MTTSCQPEVTLMTFVKGRFTITVEGVGTETIGTDQNPMTLAEFVAWVLICKGARNVIIIPEEWTIREFSLEQGVLRVAKKKKVTAKPTIH